MPEQPSKNRISLGKSFACAWRGIVTASQGRNFRIQCFIGALAFVLCWIFNVTGAEFLVVIIFTVAVLSAECANTALEALVDLVSPNYDELAGLAKDCSAGAVLLLSIGALFAACIIFIPKFLALIG